MSTKTFEESFNEAKQEYLANPQMFDGYLNPKKNEDENSFQKI